MNFRTFVNVAPAPLRGILYALCDWMDRTDKRLADLEAAAKGGR